MTDVKSLINVEVVTQLQQLSKLAHQENKSDEDIHNLKEISKKTLALIDAEIDNVSVISKNYLEIFSNLISSAINSEYWNNLPSASKVRADLQQIKATTTAISESMQFFPVDIEKVMSEIIKAQAEVMQSYAHKKALATRLQIKLNESEIANKKSANLKELQGSLISASLKVGSGALQIGSGFYNSKSAAQSLVDSKKALDMAGDLSKIKMEMIPIQSKLSKSTDKIEELNIKRDILISDIKSSNITDQSRVLKTKQVKDIDLKIKEIKNPSQNISYDSSKNALKKFEVTEGQLSREIDSLNSIARARTEVTAGRTASINALGGVGVALADGAAALMKSQAGLDEINAEVDRQASALTGAVEQGYLDSYQQIRNAINDLIQRLSAIEQAISNSVSAQVRA